jgi:hypothetical protein
MQRAAREGERSRLSLRSLRGKQARNGFNHFDGIESSSTLPVVGATLAVAPLRAASAKKGDHKGRPYISMLRSLQLLLM